MTWTSWNSCDSFASIFAQFRTSFAPKRLLWQAPHFSAFPKPHFHYLSRSFISKLWTILSQRKYLNFKKVSRRSLSNVNKTLAKILCELREVVQMCPRLLLGFYCHWIISPELCRADILLTSLIIYTVLNSRPWDASFCTYAADSDFINNLTTPSTRTRWQHKSLLLTNNKRVR